MSSVISSKGQVTIPMSIRSQMNWETGDALDFVLFAPDRVEIVVRKTPVTALKSIMGRPVRPALQEASLGTTARR